MNDTGYQLATVDDNFVIGTFLISALRNQTGVLFGSDNYTVSSTGLVTNTTNGNLWNITTIQVDFTYTLKSGEEVSSNDMIGNMTVGIDEVSAKIPTVLLIAAIILILGVLAILVGVWHRMNIGGGTASL